MTIKHGDILSVQEGFIIHGCNAFGVMGGGLALQIRNKYPKAYEEYVNAYKQSGYHLPLGRIIPVWVTDKLCIVNAITQEFYGSDGRRYVDYDAVRTCFKSLAEYWTHPYDARIEAVNPMVHYPQIGAGLAGGDWNVIHPIIEQELQNIPKTLWIYP